MLKWIILAVVILALIALVLANIRVVPQSKAFVLERLGTFYATWQTGLHVKIPFIDRIAKTVSLKEQVVDFKPQAVITKDNVTMQIDTVVFVLRLIVSGNSLLKTLFLQGFFQSYRHTFIIRLLVSDLSKYLSQCFLMIFFNKLMIFRK